MDGDLHAVSTECRSHIEFDLTGVPGSADVYPPRSIPGVDLADLADLPSISVGFQTLQRRGADAL